jgi:putative restriction endonuclease
MNQNQTYKLEVSGGFLWSPKTRADGTRHYFYRTMKEVVPGDLVFSFCDTYIKAIGVVQRPGPLCRSHQALRELVAIGQRSDGL